MRRSIMITVAVLLAAVLAGLTVWIALPAIPTVQPPENIASEIRDDNPSDVLIRFCEDPLTAASFAEGTTYRLILYPTFDRPILAQAHLDAFGPYLRTKILDGKGGYDLGHLAVSEERPMTRREWNDLRQVIDDSKFWSAPSDPGEPVSDGADWYLSGCDFDNFHSIHRISPKQKTLDSFLYLLRLSRRANDYKGYWK